MANKYNLAEQENILESGNELAAIEPLQPLKSIIT